MKFYIRKKLVDTNQSKSYNNNTFKMVIVHHHQCAIAAFNAGHNYIFPTGSTGWTGYNQTEQKKSC